MGPISTGLVQLSKHRNGVSGIGFRVWHKKALLVDFLAEMVHFGGHKHGCQVLHGYPPIAIFVAQRLREVLVVGLENPKQGFQNVNVRPWEGCLSTLEAA